MKSLAFKKFLEACAQGTCRRLVTSVRLFLSVSQMFEPIALTVSLLRCFQTSENSSFLVYSGSKSAEIWISIEIENLETFILNVAEVKMGFKYAEEKEYMETSWQTHCHHPLHHPRLSFGRSLEPLHGPLLHHRCHLRAVGVEQPEPGHVDPTVAIRLQVKSEKVL